MEAVHAMPAGRQRRLLERGPPITRKQLQQWWCEEALAWGLAKMHGLLGLASIASLKKGDCLPDGVTVVLRAGARRRHHPG